VVRSLDDAPAWERIAAEAGYTDQSHLVRDFRALVGTTQQAFCGGRSSAAGTVVA